METVKVIHNGKAFNAEVMTMWEWARRMKAAQAEREKESADHRK